MEHKGTFAMVTRWSLLYLLLLALVLPEGRPAMAASRQVVSCLTTMRGKTVALVNGQPYLMYGVQIRIDNFLNGNFSDTQWALADGYFEKAREAGFQTVIVPVRWSTVEPTEGDYNFASYVDHVIADANHYDLKVQLLWYGADVCGYNQVPKYVVNDQSRFPRNARYSNVYDLSAPALIARASAALAALMAHIAATDTQKRVIMVQVENEPDGAGSIPLVWGNSADMAAKMFAGGQFDAVNTLINRLGDVVHQSPRDVITRCNVGTTYRALDMFNARWTTAPGCDIYGVDSYSNDTSKTKAALNTISVTTPGNVAHQPEGGGNYHNLVSLILSNFEEGGGYMVYELRSSDWSGGDDGIYRKTAAGTNNWVVRDGTQPVSSQAGAGLETSLKTVQNLNRMIYKADKQLATAIKGQCAAFNLADISGPVSEQRTVGPFTVTFQSNSGGSGFALLEDTKHLLLMSATDGTVFTGKGAFAPNNVASVGYFNADNQWVEQSRRRLQGSSLRLSSGEVARLPVAD